MIAREHGERLVFFRDMTHRDEILKTVENSMERIKAIDENIIGECVGVSHALGDLRKALDKIALCLDERTYQEAASLGYSDVASAFIFLQRTLGGLQHAYNQKEQLVSEIALKSGVGVYEEVAPFVDDQLVSSQKLSETEKRKNNNAAEEMLAGKYRDERLIEVEVEIDAETLKWFQENFDNWQAAMNAVLVLHCERRKVDDKVG